MDIKIVVSTRIDKFLWAARFYKTRSLATDDIGKGRVKINGQLVKAAREVRAGDCVAIQRDGLVCSIDVLQVSEQLQPEPALSIEQGRPTKRQRRALDDARQDPGNTGWGDRWSASIDD
jgi:ribosome-associated heat shock protein Hsp15